MTTTTREPIGPKRCRGCFATAATNGDLCFECFNIWPEPIRRAICRVPVRPEDIDDDAPPMEIYYLTATNGSSFRFQMAAIDNRRFVKLFRTEGPVFVNASEILFCGIIHGEQFDSAASSRPGR